MTKESPLIDNQLNTEDGNVGYYAELFQNYRTSQLKQFRPAKASIYITSYLRQRYTDINDNLTKGFYRCVKQYRFAAKNAGDEKVLKEAHRLGHQVKKVSDILYLLANINDGDVPSKENVLSKIFSIFPKKDLCAVADFMSQVELDKKRFIWDYYAKNEAKIKRNIRRLFLALDFDIDKAQPRLAVQVVQAKQELKKFSEIRTIDESLIRPSDLPYLQIGKDSHKVTNAFLFEVYLYQQLFKALDNDVCFVKASFQYRPLDDYLVDKKDMGRLIKAMPLPTFDIPIRTLAGDLEDRLNEKISSVSNRIIEGENSYVVFSDRINSIKWSLSVKADKPKVNNDVFEQFDQIDIIGLMRIVNQETNFFTEFTHFQPKYQRTKPILDDILACILGNGTNFGLYKIASISDRSFNSLRSAQSNYIRVDTLRAANDVIANKTAELPIFEYYQINNNGKHGSIDGQKFECRFNSLMAQYSPKYFAQEKGVSAMSLVYNHIPVNSKIISADEHESYHIFDLLHNNTSQVKPDTLSTDTAGTNKYNFGILHFFGYQFAPRYKTFKDQFERMFNVESDEEAVSLISIKTPIDWELIIQEWENICQLMVSLGHHKTSQSVLIKKLCRFKSNTATLKALAEYDRAIKAQYILDYIDSETLRRQVQTALNRGESFHFLRRVIAETNGKKFRGTHQAELSLWNECARLIANCVIHYNAQILSGIKIHHEEEGNKSQLDVLKRISPVA